MAQKRRSSPPRPRAKAHRAKGAASRGVNTGVTGDGRTKKPSPNEPLWLYGRHAVAAAIANPNRQIKKIAATKGALDWLAESGGDFANVATPVEDVRPDAFDRMLPPGAVHQGIAAAVQELPRARLQDDCNPDGTLRPVLVLDQISDPQNIGALFRSAAAFNARAIVVQDRRTPPLAGALAKAAAGGIETVPCVRVVNIARALEGLSRLGYHCGGLSGDTQTVIADTPKDKPLALVMGAEGAGLRHLVATTCDALYRIPINPAMESLNVSNAAAIALYEATRP